MRENVKLLVVAVLASAVTLGAVKLLEPTPVQASAPAADLLPPDFKKGAGLVFATTENGGTIKSVYGEWLLLTNGEEDWWINANRPGLYYTVTPGK